MRRTNLALAAVMGLLGAGIVAPADALPASGLRVDLKVLVVTQGDSGTAAIASQLDHEGVPYDTLDLTNTGRSKITASYLSDKVDGVERGKYQAVVLPNANPFTDSTEYSALTSYEKKFGARQFDAYVWPGASVGLQTPFFTGPMDGFTPTVTSAARSGAFKYLKGKLQFEDISWTVTETWVNLAKPVEKLPSGASFEPMVTATEPGGYEEGVVLGAYTADGRSELVSTASFRNTQQEFLLLAPGIVEWLTDGVHLGAYRNYFAVHVDDIFAADGRWSTEGNCTSGMTDCPEKYTQPNIRMNEVDVLFAAAWQKSRNFKLDLLFNGFGSDRVVTETGKADALAAAFQSNASNFRWADHTYSHPFLGCTQDDSVNPWRCVTDSKTGAVTYVTQKTIQDEITNNLTWASKHGITVDASELVTGEHSGLFILPQQKVDNPNLAPALAATGVKWIGSDNSRDPAQRAVGSALTVPRYPINLFYNIATRAEAVDEYNWIYTSKANGGSGICETTNGICVEPLKVLNGYMDTIVASETHTALTHILGNDPRPHFVHQSNLAEDRLLYPLLEKILSTYRSTFADNTPIVNERMSSNGAELRRQAAWKSALAAGTASGYLLNGKVVIKAPKGLDVPVSVPDGTRISSSSGKVFGTSYAGSRSDYWSADGTNLTLVLSAGQSG